jgi:Phage integrase, N-terminal SAM-like domain
VRAYAHDLRDFLAFLESRGIAWDGVVLEDLGRFVAWLRLSGPARSSISADDDPSAGLARCVYLGHAQWRTGAHLVAP